MKPRIFIGSSSEGEKYANAIQTNLQPANECVVWTQGFFNLTNAFLESLIDQLSSFDFGIFVLSPDDKVLLRGAAYSMARDNVIFELGLFMGRLGRERTFIARPTNTPDLHLPSDLLGISHANFDAERGDKNWEASLAPACRAIQACIDKLGPMERHDVRDATGATVRYVAAICYRLEADTVKLLLVNTTRSRRMFPKGRVQDGEDPKTAAERYAYEEGGVYGRAVDVPAITFKHFKEEGKKSEQIVATILIEVRSSLTMKAKFRDPIWANFADSELELAKDRDFQYVEELRKVVRWSKEQIGLLVKPRIQSGAVPFRKSKTGVEVLLITSRTNRSWIFPKGNIKGSQDARAVAEREAYEEAGVAGRLHDEAVGKYSYSRAGVRYSVEIFALEVEKEFKSFQESDFRSKRWVGVDDLDNLVEYEHVKQMVLDFRNKISKYR